MRSLLALLLFFIWLRSPAAGPAAPGLLDQLARNSPFGRSGPNPSAAKLADSLEFRGVYEENGRRYFSLFDAAERHGAWVEMNELGIGWAVTAYNPATETVVVTRQDRSLTLKLRNSTVTSPASLAKAPAAPVMTPPRDPAITDQPFRVGHVAEETLIRRAVRQTATPTPHLAAPAGSPDLDRSVAAMAGR